jgi:RNA polymerase sigma factor (sigma-70 family)
MTPHASHAIWIEEFAASYRDLLRFLRRRTRCEETARDLAQDAWLRVTERQTGSDAPPPTSPDHARAHIFVIAERLAIDHLRRQRHWHEELAPRLLAGPRHAPDVAEAHAYAQALRAVDGALAGMPARMREVFVTHRLDGVQHDELAQRYQVSRKTIEREVTKAMDIAQTALAGETTRQGRRKTIGALLGLAGIGTSASVAWQAWREWVPQWQTAFATPAGRIGHLPLPEGSENSRWTPTARWTCA